MASVKANDDWVVRLKSDDTAVRDAALQELREILIRGLSRSLNYHYGNRVFNPEDVVQDALLKILASMDSFEGRSRFTTWAMTIATRVGISALRRRHCQDVSLEGISPENSLRLDLTDQRAQPVGSDLDQQSILVRLQELIDSVLTPKQRWAIRALLEGLPIEEIAHRTSSNRNAIYKLVHDARMRLKEGFQRAGIAAEDVRAIFA